MTSKIKTIPVFSGKDEDFVSFINQFRCYAISQDETSKGLIDLVLRRDSTPSWVRSPTNDDEKKLFSLDRSLCAHLLTALPADTRDLISRKVYQVEGSFVRALQALQQLYHSSRKSRSYFSTVWESYRYTSGDPIEYINLKLLAQENVHPNIDDQEVVDRLFDHLPETFNQAQARVRPCDSIPSAIDEIRAHWKRHMQKDEDKSVAFNTYQSSKSSSSSSSQHGRRRGHREHRRHEGQQHRQYHHQCNGCGQGHKRAQCPHLNSICHNCGIKGHISRVCRKKEHANSIIASKEFSFITTATQSTSASAPIIHAVLDSGTTQHIFPSETGLHNIRAADQKVTVANGNTVSTSIIGDVKARIRSTTGEFITITLSDVCVLPASPHHLISISKICQNARNNGIKFDFAMNDEEQISLSIEDHRIHTIIQDRLPILPLQVIPTEAVLSSETVCETALSTEPSKASLHEWHLRMNHMGKQQLLDLSRKVHGMVITDKDVEVTCSECKQTKLGTKKPFNPGHKEEERFLQRVHVDIMGPIKPIAESGANYISHHVDAFSGLIYARIGKNIRSRNLQTFEAFHQSVGIPEIYRLDNSTENRSKAIWNRRFTEAFNNSNMQQSNIDPTFFYNSDRLSAIQVDDTLSSATSRQHLDQLASALRNDGLTVTIDYEPTNFCGMQVFRDQGGITIYARNKIDQLIKKFNIDSTLRIPYSDRRKLQAENEKTQATKEEVALYRSIIGSLIWISTVRPDILFSTIECSRFCSNPQKQHWEYVRNILRYLNATPCLGIHFSTGSILRLIAYSDSTWADDVDNRLSTSGILILLAGGPIVAKSVRQKSAALSSMEAEIMAITDTIKEIIFIHDLLSETSIKLESTTIRTDSESAVKAIFRPGSLRDRTKHIGTRLAFIRYHLRKYHIQLHHICRAGQIADMMAKYPPPHEFLAQRDSFMRTAPDV